MAEKHFIILGAGISGLSAAFFLRQKHPNAHIQVIEKKDHAGGAISSVKKQGFFFECGPRTFKVSRCHDLLRLIDSVGLRLDLLGYDPPLKAHYIWLDEALHRVTANPLKLLTNPLTRSFWKAFFSEYKRPRILGDESVWEFGLRRFGRQFTERILQPILVGIFAGDIRNLSVKMAMPRLKAFEAKYGSISKGMRHSFFEKKMPCPIPELEKCDLFTLKNGMQELIDRLVEVSKSELVLNQNVESLPQADHVFVALPGREAARVVQHPLLDQLVKHMDFIDILSVNFGFEKKVLNLPGYGYLVPPLGTSQVLGVIFDSNIFSDQNTSSNETRITAMMGGSFHTGHIELSDSELYNRALKDLSRHIHLDAEPDGSHISRFSHYIPLFHVDHEKRLEALKNTLKVERPNITLLGNYLRGASVNECVKGAGEAVLG